VSTIVGSTANIAQTVAFNAIGCSVSSPAQGTYLVAFGVQAANPSPVQMPQPWSLGSAYAFVSYAQNSAPVSQQFVANVTAVPALAPVQLTLSTVSGLAVGNIVTVTGIQGAAAANGTFTVSSIVSLTVTLAGSFATGSYTGGGVVLGPLVVPSGSQTAQLVTQPTQAFASLPATTISSFAAALSSAAQSSGLSASITAYLGWVAFWDYVRQGGT